MQTKTKFKDKEWKLGVGPVFLVGQNPGKQRKGEQTGRVWEGNRSSDLLLQACLGKENLYFTNICNHQEICDKLLQEKMELRQKIIDYEPRLVICLGNFAYEHLTSLNLNVETIGIQHPSYIARFNKDKEAYVKQIRELIG